MEVGRRRIAYRRPVYIPWHRDIKKRFVGCTHQRNNRKGKAQIGKMDAILRESQLDIRTKRCILRKVIVPKLEYAGEV